MKYINQREYPHWLYITRTDMEPAESEKGKTTTIKSSGCGLCSAVMVADRLLPNNKFDLEDALNLSYECKANHRIGTDFKRFVPVFAEKQGLYFETSNDPQHLLNCLRTGGAAIIHVKGDREGRVGVFSHIGHYITAISEERDGRIAILDPSVFDGKFEEEGRHGLIEFKNEVIALCDIQVIAEDSAPADPSFYLFWRK